MKFLQIKKKKKLHSPMGLVAMDQMKEKLIEKEYGDVSSWTTERDDVVGHFK